MNYIPDKDRYSTMKYNRCGNSGLFLPSISLGLWHNFGDVDNFEESRKIIRRAFDLGITHFDLANNYGPPPGSAEKNFGKILHKDFRKYRHEMIISTKAGYLMWPGPYGEWGSRKYLMTSLDQSLKRMKVDYVDIFYSHRPDPTTPLEETTRALADAVKQGKALYAGISNYSVEQTKKAAELMRTYGTPCLIHQPKYSMFERWIENGLLDTLEEYGIGCIAFSPLAQGILTERYLEGIPKGSRASKAHGFLKKKQITADKIDKVKRLKAIAKKRGQSISQMALSWIMKDKRITSVLVGVSSVGQLENNIEFMTNIKFDNEELNIIEDILKN